MNGRRGNRLIPISMVVAIALQLAPVSFMTAGLNAVAGDRLQGVDLNTPMKPLQSPIQSASKAIQDETAYTMQQLDESDNGSSSQTLQGSVTSIRVTRGRSQIVKFAQPIMRISIAEPTVADVIPLSPDQIMINGKLRGVTSLIVWDENGQEGIFDLYVQNDTSELLDAVKAIAPNEKIQARVTDDSFILSGQVTSTVVLDEIRKTASAYGFRDDKFIDLTDTPVPQVVLEVKMAEATRSVGRILRTAFSADGTNFSATRLSNVIDSKVLGNMSVLPNLAVGRATSGIIPGQLADGSRHVAKLMSASNTGGITGHYRFGGSLDTMWDMLETSGKINTLANPTLVCTHGRSASFLAGGEYPFVGSVDQNGSPVISFKEFGVKLNFTPWISIKSGRIEIKVEPEVSSLDQSNCVAGAGGSQVCGVLSRKTSTTVELQDGDSLMISGILSREEQNNFSKVPFIGNVPVLGNLFKNGDMSKTDRELVVIITPRIIKPTDYGKVLGSAH